jgi:hypothetical protein
LTRCTLALLVATFFLHIFTSVYFTSYYDILFVNISNHSVQVRCLQNTTIATVDKDQELWITINDVVGNKVVECELQVEHNSTTKFLTVYGGGMPVKEPIVLRITKDAVLYKNNRLLALRNSNSTLTDRIGPF